jgi:hypothetical protein
MVSDVCICFLYFVYKIHKFLVVNGKVVEQMLLGKDVGDHGHQLVFLGGLSHVKDIELICVDLAKLGNGFVAQVEYLLDRLSVDDFKQLQVLVSTSL